MTEKTISQVLHEIQINLAVPKSRYNAFGKYNYRNAEDIVDAVKKLLPDGYVLNLSDDIVMLGNRFYVKATAALSIGNDIIHVYGWAREPDEKKGVDASQITGGASSYARKYALNGLFAIDDGVDSDSQDNTNKPKIESIADKRVTAESYVKDYLLKLEQCKTFDDMEALTTSHQKKLLRIHAGYPDLSSAINLAVQNKRAAL